MNAISTDEATDELRELVKELTSRIVTDPEKLLVMARREGDCVLVNVSATDEQLGRLVGRNGDTARALRRIVAAVAGKCGVSCQLNIGLYATAGK